MRDTSMTLTDEGLKYDSQSWGTPEGPTKMKDPSSDGLQKVLL